MARSTSTDRSTDAPRDAIALLKQDHRTVSQLFEEFEKADEEEQSAIAQRVCQLLTVHAQIEEELLYPLRRKPSTTKTTSIDQRGRGRARLLRRS